ncbi:hypothetical protein [Streptomyces sp. NPDC058335]|uniref:hypothetical protein n=1 Tax=Streptomyces sp. NPDC058335 TaxID=3346451 RepID=UPI0036497F87
MHHLGSAATHTHGTPHHSEPAVALSVPIVVATAALWRRSPCTDCGRAWGRASSWAWP